MKILISGGHLTPALAFIDFVQEHHPEDEVIFVGRAFSQRKLQQVSVERSEIEKRKRTFVEFDSGKFDTQDLLNLPVQFIKLSGSIFRAKRILNEFKPDIFLSFGGYLAVPLAVAAKLQGIPVVTHEQTTSPGMANRLISRFANSVAVSFPESEKIFPQDKTTLTGNPIRKNLWLEKATQPDWVMKPSQRPLLYVTGGSQGSQAINSAIQQILPELLEEWDVIHQCGKPNSLVNYKKELEQSKSNLTTELQSRYVIREEWISEAELNWIYKHAWAMISRSGANTVQEVIKAEIPTLFIPLARSHHDEQLKNAQSLVQKNAAVLLLQNDLDKSHLISALHTLKRTHPDLKKALAKLSKELPWNADERLYALVAQTAHAQ